MSKFKIEKGISRIARVKLQATVEESIAADLALLGEWSNNDKNYIVNELLHALPCPRTAISRLTKNLSASRTQNQDRQGRLPPCSHEQYRRARPSQARKSLALVLGYSGGNVLSRLKTLCRILVRHRFLFSAGLSAAAGIILNRPF
jgi:hypothetical protein